MLNFADVVEALTGIKLENSPLVISEAVIDSRLAIPASMFIAIPGERADGHNFIAEAFKRGSSIALVQKDLPEDLPVLDLRGLTTESKISIPETPFCIRVDDTLSALQKIAGFWRSKFNVRVIGITGSVGKSTTKELIAEVLSQRYRTLKNIGNLNNEIGLPLTLLRLGEGYQRTVLEMGFYVPGEIDFLCGLAKPVIGVVTNIGTVHAERAGSQEEIARGKSELVAALPEDGLAILNYDDPWVKPMAEKTKARVFYYGLDPKADLWADNIIGLGLKGIRFNLHYRKETIHIRIPLIGRHSVHTALRAAAVGLSEGLTWGEILTGLQYGHSQLRLMAVNTENGALLLDDTYNSSPESTMAALNLLEEMDGKKIAVLGDMLELGQYEKQGHEMVGVRAAQVVDQLIAVGEKAKMIADAAFNAGLPKKRILWVESVDSATQTLRETLQAKDVVLVKGSHSLRMDRIISELEAAS
ncbi:MAG: UDP-N-acetylmuramoyl-tripeptide--D-alanyl-D-alanine ligase [Anaerolineaceae bacterium]|nr:UDP-N-acetylmuramoyl-tripeptide--D-alanyl-D-alanine ligase [Anaerolineaceae bacterium]